VFKELLTPLVEENKGFVKAGEPNVPEEHLGACGSKVGGLAASIISNHEFKERWSTRPSTCTRMEGKLGTKALLALQKTGAWNPEQTLDVDLDSSPLAEELKELFASLSTPEICDPHHMMLPVLPSYGLGATLNFLIQPATVSIAHNVTLLTPPLGKWGSLGRHSSAKATMCDSHTFDRFLKPFSTCDERAVLGRTPHPVLTDDLNTEMCGELGEKSTMCRCSGYNQVEFLRDAMVSVDENWLQSRYLDKASGACSVPMYMSAVHVRTVQKQRKSMPKHSIFHAENSFKHLPKKYQKQAVMRSSF